MSSARLGLGLALTVVVGCSASSPADEPGLEVGVDGSLDLGVDARADEGVDTSGDTAFEADAPVDGGTDAPPSDKLLEPTVACAPKGDTCTAKPDDRSFVGFRKDFFLPLSKHNEPNPDPKDGGRFQIAASAKVTGTVTGVTLDGAAYETLFVEPKLEWLHVWPKEVKAGEPMWVSFHSRDPKWNAGGTARVVVKTAAGDALDVVVSAKAADVRLTYVTTNVDRDELLVHVRNESDTPKKVTKLLVDGRDVTSAACLAEPTIPARTSVLYTVPLCKKAALGAAWTVVAEIEGGLPAVGTGRVIRPFFPIETWANSSDCPFPSGGKADNLAKHLAAGIDTYFMYVGGSGDGCSYDTMKIINEVAPKRSDFWPFVADGFLGSSGWDKAITDSSRVAGFLLGDEVDGTVYPDGKSKAATDMAVSAKLWAAYPEVPTYIGSKTNRNVGAFAGATDIQGSDFYVAACAPHITQFGTHPPIDAAYDYLKNTRDNHMPLPTWLYGQGLSPAWNKKALITGAEVVSQPDPQEILVQGFSVMAAGAKGFMWFQTNMKEAERVPARWDAISYVSWTTRGVRELLRSGDLIGGVKTTGSALVDAIRAKEGVVVPVISTKTSSGPTDLGCQTALGGVGAIPHWQMAPQTLDVSVTVPTDLAVAEVLEVTDKTVKVVAGIKVTGRTLTIPGVALDNGTPARVFVLASSKDLSAKIAAQLKK